ncbi:MAG: hypothetical protein RIF33_00065 [Cyclobacteriaceae bacterium]
MKLTFWLLGSLLLAFIDINDIAAVNALKRSAEQAFMNKNYEQAALDYSMLIDSMQVLDDRAMLNLAHAYYQLSDSSNARNSYQRLTMTDDKQLKSIAYQQLGMLNSSPDQLQKSLHFFKESVRANPANEEARYNYELVKKKLQEQEDQQQDQDEENEEKNQEDQEKNEDQEKQDQEKQDQEQKENEESQDQENQDQEQQDQEQEQQEQEDSKEQQQQEEQEQKDGEQEQQEPQEGEESEQSEEEQPMPSPSEKLEEMNLSEEKAQMILEAMRNSEVQYLQQMKKKATKKADSKKPDW